MTPRCFFFQEGFVKNALPPQEKKNPSRSSSKENICTVEKSNLRFVMFVVFLLLENAMILENYLRLQELSLVQAWASKNIPKSVKFQRLKYACKIFRPTKE